MAGTLEGKAIVNLVDTKEEKIINMFNINEFTNSKIAFLTSKGLVKKVKAVLFSRPRANGVRAINIREGDRVEDATTIVGERKVPDHIDLEREGD